MFGLSGLELKALFLGATMLAGFVSGCALTHRLDLATVEKLKLGIVQAHEKALQAALDQQRINDAIATAAAQKEASAQRSIADRTAAQLREIKRHVANGKPCVTLGFVRVLDAAILGINADALPLPAGKSDDACSAFTADELARSVTANYGTAKANGEQLDALIETLRKMAAAQKK